jgi:DNA-3-methyladenine glycosylase
LILPRRFFARGTLIVAREMLGKELVHVGGDGVTRSGRIVETEAYVGPDDLASHARVGPKGRAALMYGMAGVAYVYLVYGMHHCFNAVTEQEGHPGAVLVRAIEPLQNAVRGNGPALVCRALQIDRGSNGLDLTTSSSPLFLEDAPRVPDADVRVGPRVGVDYAGEWAAHPWRFWIADSQHNSRRRVTGLLLDPAMLR